MKRAMMLSIVAGVAGLLASRAASAPGARATQDLARRRVRSIVVETEKGTFEFETYPNEAPKTVAHIVGLVNKRFYNGQRVHRVVPGFVVQFGDPQTRDMTKREDVGPRRQRHAVGVAEFTKQRTHVRGAVALAHLGDAAKADSQIYVTLADRPASTASTRCSAR